MSQKIRILHLSDLHIPLDFEESEEYARFKEALIADLQEQKKKDGAWDVLVVSGDLIDKGNIEIFEKQKFRDMFKEIIRITGVDKKVIMVPGNHDAKRPTKQSGVNLVRERMIEDSLNRDTLDELEVRFKHFRKGCNSIVRGMCSKEETFGIKDLMIKGNYYRFISLNSSLGTRDACDYGNLIISKIQLSTLVKKINKKIKPKVTFLVMHHPIDWLSYQERCLLQEYMENESGLNVDIILHGHIHDGQINLTSSLDSHIVTLVTGIGYEKNEIFSDNVNHSRRPNHYRYATYEVDSEANTIHGILRKTNDKANFMPDTSMYRKINQNGEFIIPLKIDFKLETYELNIPLYGKQLVSPRVLDKIDFVLAKTREFRNYMIRDINSKLGRRKRGVKTTSDKIASAFMQMCINFKLFYFPDIDNNNIRIHLRHYFSKGQEDDSGCHDAFISFSGDVKKTVPVSKIAWGTKNNLIYYAYKEQRTLIGTLNQNYAYVNPNSEWDEFITVALSYNDFTPETIPPLSFGVSFKWKDMDKDKIDDIYMILLAMSYVGINHVLQEIITYIDMRCKIKNNIEDILKK